jgi:hypothetical protein
MPVDGQPRESNRGRPPLWSDERVERELRTLLAGRTAWPTPAEFKDAGKGALYAAASRRGSISRWRRMFGL